MDFLSIIGKRQLALVAAATFGIGAATAGAAHATPTASPSASVAGGTLTILGTPGDDSFAIRAGDPNTLDVDLGNGGQPQRFDRHTFDTISVALRGGDDHFQVSPGASLADENLAVVGGAGNDTIVGGDGNDTLSGGSGDDDIQGRDGTDLIFGDPGHDTVNGNRGNDTEILGPGHDTAVWNPGEANDVINGGPGHDSLAFNGSDGDEIMSLSPNGTQAVFLRNLGSVRMDLNRVEQLDLATFGGADQVLVDNMAGTDVRTANVDLSSAQGTGDRSVDTVTVNGTDNADRIKVDGNHNTVAVSGLRAETRISGSETTDQLAVHTGGGNDRVDVRDDAKALIGVTVDLGDGQR